MKGVFPYSFTLFILLVLNMLSIYNNSRTIYLCYDNISLDLSHIIYDLCSGISCHIRFLFFSSCCSSLEFYFITFYLLLLRLMFPHFLLFIGFFLFTNVGPKCKGPKVCLLKTVIPTFWRNYHHVLSLSERSQ